MEAERKLILDTHVENQVQKLRNMDFGQLPGQKFYVATARVDVPNKFSSVRYA